MEELLIKQFKDKLKIAIINHYRILNEKFKGDVFYGYALYTSDDISSIGPVTNRKSDIVVGTDDEMYNYYKYSPDEWSEWDDFEQFNEVNQIIKEFHSKADFTFEQIKEYVLSQSLLTMQELDKNGFFGVKNNERFLIIWISDSDDQMMNISAKQLNTLKVYEDYSYEFEES